MPFGDVLGQEPAKRLLAFALRRNRLAHSYLFHGPDGVGKVSLARSLFRAALCRANPGEGCLACGPCRRVAKDLHPDVSSLFVPEDKRSIPVESVRDLLAEAAKKPVEGSLRFFLIDDAHLLGDASANALLKTLEEPPPRTVLILTATRPTDVLPTVASRCQAVRFFPLPQEAVEASLRAEDPNLSPDAARSAALLAEGSLGRARAWLQGGLLAIRDELIASLLDVRDGKPIEGAERFVAAIDGLPAAKRSRAGRRKAIQAGLKLAQAILRDAALHLSGAGATDGRLLPDRREAIEALASEGDPDEILSAALSACERASDGIDRNLREDLVVAECFLGLAPAFVRAR